MRLGSARGRGLVQHYTDLEAGNPPARYLPALTRVNGSASHQGLDPGFVADWHRAAQDPFFQRAQDDERDPEARRCGPGARPPRLLGPQRGLSGCRLRARPAAAP
jgi:hypothetical protein